jgi:23S rRNA (uridine2552-2'-O)-methyltransferase
MPGKDEYYNRAKVEGYRARSAFKLKQLDETAGLFAPGNVVVDLGAAPGGWLQVAAERVGPDGAVIGVDRQRIDDLEDPEPRVELLRGDVTEDDTCERIRAVAAELAEDGTRSPDDASAEEDDREPKTSDAFDISPDSKNVSPGSAPDTADAADAAEAAGDSRDADGASTADDTSDLQDVDGPSTGAVDVVLSDMAPNVSGQYELDHARSVHLARQAFETAKKVLAPGGDFVAKVFQGQDLGAFKADVDEAFDYARTVVPDATRDSSSEVYVVGKHRIMAPVAAGEAHTVEITDEGSEGDGVAHVDGFTVFVPGADVGETVDVRIDEVKPRFAFAERLA